MFRNTLTFKFGKFLGIFYLSCAAACLFTIAAEKIYYIIKQAPVPDYGLIFVVVILINAFVILAANFFVIEIILFVIDCFRIKKILNSKKEELSLLRQIFEYFLFSISVLVPVGYICAILPNIK